MRDNRKLGTELHPDDRKHVLAAYVHRMTVETRASYPDFAKRMVSRGYKLDPITDDEWLACTTFAVRVDGRLDRRVSACQSMHPYYHYQGEVTR